MFTFRMLELVERFELCAKAEVVMFAALEVELGVTVVIGTEAGLAEVAAEGSKVETAVFSEVVLA